jgi:predicted aspartyl protease
MHDVGILRTTIGVESHQRRGDVRQLADTLVDTGSEYSWIPRDVLKSLGIGVERAQRFRTADGRVVHRVMGYAIIHAGGTRTSDEVVFAEPGDMVLLGAHTIEGLNLRIDLKTRQLVPAGPVPAAPCRRRSLAWAPTPRVGDSQAVAAPPCPFSSIK